MNWIRKLVFRVKALFQKGKLDAEMDEEMRAHIEMRTQQNIEAGMSPDEARYAALQQFGWTESIKETCRDNRGVSWIEHLVQDIRFGARMLRKNPGFTTVAILTLALGIGSNTAIFSILDAILLRPLPIPRAERVVQVWESWRGEGTVPVAWPKFVDWREQAKSFEAIAGCDWGNSFTFIGGDRPEKIPGRTVSSGFFEALQISPILGRTLGLEDTKPGATPVALIGHDLWRNRFNGDPNVIGKTIRIDFKSYSVIGVLPESFRMANKAQIFLPKIEEGELLTEREDHSYQVLARLKRDVTLDQAQAEMATIAARLEAEHPKTDKEWKVKLVRLREQLTGDLRRLLLVLMGAVSFVLLIACANIGTLLLARAAARKEEMAIRAALGAARSRIIRQLMTESVLFSALGGALGVALAYLLLAVVRALRPELEAPTPWGISMSTPLQIDFAVLGFTVGVSLLAAVLFGTVPALISVRKALIESLKEGERGMTQSWKHNRTRTVFVVGEVALALMLLVGAGLMVRSFWTLARTKPGFRMLNMLTFAVNPAEAKIKGTTARARYFDTLCEKLRGLPGVESVAGTLYIPLAGGNSTLSTKVHGRPPLPEGLNNSNYQVVTPNFFGTMGIPLLRGRDFTERDTTNAPLVVIVNETFARKIFPNENPIGQHIGIGDGWYRNGDNLPREIIGVVQDVRQSGLNQEPVQQVYVPHSQSLWNFGANLIVRTKGEPDAIIPAVRETVWSMDKDQALGEFKTIERVVSDSIAPQRFNASLLSGFALSALLLALIGIYGVLAYAVTQRRREIGLRMALGAQRKDVLGLILRQGAILIGAGAVVGLAGAIALTRVMQNLLYGVGPTDPVTFTLITLLLGLVALFACWIPARRASKLDPMVALRHE